MSVLIFKAGVMACDTAGFRGSFVTTTSSKKITRTPFGVLVGCTGLKTYGDRFTEWANGGFVEEAKPPPLPDSEKDEFGAIVAFPDGRVLEYAYDMLATDVSAEPMVCEGAANEACFALHTMGLSAVQIVNWCILHCVWAGGEVLALSLSDHVDEQAVFDEVEEWRPPPPDPVISEFLKERGLE